jgi:hypothetical protein
VFFVFNAGLKRLEAGGPDGLALGREVNKFAIYLVVTVAHPSGPARVIPSGRGAGFSARNPMARAGLGFVRVVNLERLHGVCRVHGKEGRELDLGLIKWRVVFGKLLGAVCAQLGKQSLGKAGESSADGGLVSNRKA